MTPPTYVGVGGLAWPGSSDTATMTRPSTQDNDLFVATLFCQDESRTFDTVPAGWTTELDVLTGEGRLAIYSKAIPDESAEPATYEWVTDANPGAGNEMFGQYLHWRGADMNDPIEMPRWLRDAVVQTSHTTPDMAPEIVDGAIVCTVYADGTPAMFSVDYDDERGEALQNNGGGNGCGRASYQIAPVGEGQQGALTAAATPSSTVAIASYVVRPASPIDMPVRVRGITRSDGTATSTDIVLTMPDSKRGDLLYAVVVLGNAGALNFPDIVTAPAGWTEVRAPSTGTKSGETPPRVVMAIYTKESLGKDDEPNTYTWVSNVAEHTGGAILALDGASDVDVENVGVTLLADTSDHQAPSITTTLRHCLMICSYLTETTAAQTLEHDALESKNAGAGNDYYLTIATVPIDAPAAADNFNVSTASDSVSVRHIAAIAPKLVLPQDAEVVA